MFQGTRFSPGSAGPFSVAMVLPLTDVVIDDERVGLARHLDKPVTEEVSVPCARN